MSPLPIILVAMAVLMAVAGIVRYALLPDDGQAHVESAATRVPAAAPAVPDRIMVAEATPGSSQPATTTTGWLDTPAGETLVGPLVRLTGWALDPAGIHSVDLRVGGRSYRGIYGIARPDVAALKPGFPDSHAPGFEISADLTPLLAADANARHAVEVLATNRLGVTTVLTRKSIVLPTEHSEWRSLYTARGSPSDPLFIVPGVSGIKLGGPNELNSAYASYLSPTLNVGMRVPLLYMRTTLGASNDWRFDADWDIERRCGARRIAEDSLTAILAYSRTHRVPVLFTLNGGVWADASCNVPEWDATDHLEQRKRNSQWNERNEVMDDDYLKHLPGSQESPELGRMLTLNVYAHQNRRYKKRNLQSAARAIAAFARVHPELFVGINLDPDNTINPFFEEQQWYDYNPGTLKQFRHWLAGTGPYAGRGGPDVPDLRSYRRAAPQKLTDVNTLSGRQFKRWEEVDPPRQFSREGKPFWQDSWVHAWDVFRRHLVDLHYDELSQWLVEAGIDARRIYTSQGFMGPHATAMPFAIRVDGPAKNYDTGGISVEGAIPRYGNLGATVYGPTAANESPMETADSLYATFSRLAPGWAIVEFNTADLRKPSELPDYARAYKTLHEAFNFGARLLSPMAWNGSNGLFAGSPGYVSYLALRNTPLEEAIRDFAISHAYVPRGTRLWTFGSSGFATDDGWTTEAGSRLLPRNGHVAIDANGAEAVLLSPTNLAIPRGDVDLLVLGVDSARLQSVRIQARAATGQWITLASVADASSWQVDPAGVLLPLIWPGSLTSAEQFRLHVTLRPQGKQRESTLLRHIALYRAARK